jgi:hypothetical protein
MSSTAHKVLCATIILMIAWGNYCSAATPSLAPDKQPGIMSAEQYAAQVISGWPKHYGPIITDQIATCIASSGQFGKGFGYSGFYIPSEAQWSFETPAGSGHEYLYGGGIWIGGIVGRDTLVSVATDGWLQTQEFFPTGFGTGSLGGTVNPIPSCSEIALRSICDDTLHAGATYRPDVIDGRTHIPLNIEVAQRGYAWETGRESYLALFDMVISNIGDDTIHGGYVGFYFDADIGPLSFGYFDDLAGAVAGQALAYAVDNDGELTDSDDGNYDRAFAFKFIRSSMPTSDTSFHWWVSNGDPAFDYGPMMRVNYRDFGTGGRGTPEGDRNKYHLLSREEWDFDQVMTGSIRPDDPIWLYPFDTNVVRPLDHGWDTRFLVSVGPYDLFPDSSVRIQYALLTADSIHTDPHIMDLIDFAPELYAATLGLDRLVQIAHVAESLSALLLDPRLPPHGLSIESMRADSATLSWDPWVYNTVAGYGLFVDEIPPSAYRHEGVPPPWYQLPASTPYVVTNTSRASVRDLDPYRAYTVTVAHAANNKFGEISEPVIVKLPTPAQAPVLGDTMLFVRDGEHATVRWSPSLGGVVRQYNVYRFDDITSARNRYLRHYSELRYDSAVDSVGIDGRVYYYYQMPPHAVLSADQLEYADPEPVDGAVYVVTATDTAGFESGFSGEVVSWIVHPPTKDILVLSHGLRQGTYTYEDSIDQFYHRVLNGYAYDLYSVVDTLSACQPVVPACMDWRIFTRYKLVIVDDNLRDNILRGWYEDETAGFTKYLINGGALVYCGQFANIAASTFSVFTVPAWYEKRHALLQNYFGLDSVFGIGLLYYKNNSTEPYVDSLLGFSYAEPTGDAPQISYAEDRLVFQPYLTSAWPAMSPPSVAAFAASDDAEIIYRFRSLDPARSRVEGSPVGLLKLTDQILTVTLGFHLWYMQETQARQLVDWVMRKVDVVTDIPNSEQPALPHLNLSQNYPNPFNPNTTIEFTLARTTQVRIDVYNILGQTVRTLLDEERAAGSHTIVWDGNDQRGNMAASGIYLYRMQTGGTSVVKKMVLIR